jgi:hypothetical protein
MLVGIILVRAIFLELFPALEELPSFVNDQIDKLHEAVTYKLQLLSIKFLKLLFF